MTVPLRLAVCLYPGLTALDYQGPVELFGFISSKSLNSGIGLLPLPQPYTIETTFLSHDMEPVEPSSGPRVLPNASYIDDVGQFDIVLVPGAPPPIYHNPPDVIIQFLKKQQPRAKYILGVCTGVLILAKAGILNGKKATTNKAEFSSIEKETENLPITWAMDARWVVDDDHKLWTSSGVTAGYDMASAFLGHLIGKSNAELIRNIID